MSSWTNTDLANPNRAYKDHFERAEERLQVFAKTTLQRDKEVVPPITTTHAAAADEHVALPTATDVEMVRRNAMADRGQPMPPVRRDLGAVVPLAHTDDAITHAPGRQIARPAKDATPGAASASGRPRTIGSASAPMRPLNGQAFHEDGHTSLGSALPKPGSPGGEALRQLEALHARMRLPAPRDVKPASSAEVTLARQHARTAGCERCESWLSGLASGAMGQGVIEKQARQQQARAQQRNTPPPRWPRGRS